MLGDYGGGDNTFSSLWEALPSVAVVGGQVCVRFLLFRLSSTYMLLEGFSARKLGVLW